MGQRRSLAESRPIPGNSREDSDEEGTPRVLVLYPGKWGSVDPLAESRPIPGNSREDSDEEGNPTVLVLYQEEGGSVDP